MSDRTDNTAETDSSAGDGFQKASRRRRGSGCIEERRGRFRWRLPIAGTRYTSPLFASREQAAAELAKAIADGMVGLRAEMRKRDRAREAALVAASERVYFIQGEGGGPIKIGRAAEPYQRLSDLQTAHHETLRLLATAPLNVTAEKDLHRRFRHLRLRGEWFKAAPELLEHIALLATRETRAADAATARIVVAGLRALANQIAQALDAPGREQ